MQADLTKERPIYPLSVYGPGKGEPTLIGADVSPEELRLKFYAARGDLNSYVSDIGRIALQH